MNCPAALAVTTWSHSTSRTQADGTGGPPTPSRTTPPIATSTSRSGRPTVAYSLTSVVTGGPLIRGAYTTGMVTTRSTTGFQIVSIRVQKSPSLSKGSDGATTVGRGTSSISGGNPAGSGVEPYTAAAPSGIASMRTVVT